MSATDIDKRFRMAPWLLYALATMVLWGVWGDRKSTRLNSSHT